MPLDRSKPHSEEDEYGEEAYELTESGQLSALQAKTPYAPYADGSSIDWLQEEAKERQRKHALEAQPGAKGILLPLGDATRVWFVVIATGMGIGIAGAWLDVLVKWLGDIREGHCTKSFFYNQVACSSGANPGEWHSWSESAAITSLFGASLLQCFIYVILAIAFASSAAFLVTYYAPYAFHTGIPEIKAILGGYVFDAFLSPMTLLIKAMGLALSVASGLSLGKEGPLVHISCCMAYNLSRFFRRFRHNEAQKRKLLAAAASAGVSVAFGSPLGGVLFGLEELDAFANETDVMWRGFVASAIAAVGLQWVNPFGTGKLVLFQVTHVGDIWRAFELIPWLILGVLGGLLGALLIRLNVEVALFRRNSVLQRWPILEVVCVSALTAGVSYLVVFTRVQTSDLVANLFQECDPTKGDYHGLCNPTALWENVFLLTLTAMIKLGLTAWTFGMMVPAGIFLPTIAIGACLGRAMGLITQGMYRAYPKAWWFLACPPDPSERCISPGFYAVLGASAMLGGVTRMTISLVVIVFELTGALSHVLPIMLCVMTAKWVGDAINKDGIYPVWIAMRDYPWLASTQYHDKGETGASIMTPVDYLSVIQDEHLSIVDLEKFLDGQTNEGFPILRGRMLVGYAMTDKLREHLDQLAAGDAYERTKKCCFSIKGSELPPDERIDMSSCLEKSLIQLRKEVPQELVVSMFQKLNLRRIMFTQAGELTGMSTKADVIHLLTRDFPHTAALSNKPMPQYYYPRSP